MYANHHSYNALLASLKERKLDWTYDSAKTQGKRFVEGMSKDFFQCCPYSTWKALNDRYNSIAFATLGFRFINLDELQIVYNLQVVPLLIPL